MSSLVILGFGQTGRFGRLRWRAGWRRPVQRFDIPTLPVAATVFPAEIFDRPEQGGRHG
jgi:hypothetical protein